MSRRRRSSLRRDQSLYRYLGEELRRDTVERQRWIKRLEGGGLITYEIVDKLPEGWEWDEVTAHDDMPGMRFYKQGSACRRFPLRCPKNICMKAPDVLKEL